MKELLIYLYIQKKGVKCGSREIADHFGFSMRMTQRKLNAMCKKGVLIRDNESHYGYLVAERKNED